MLVIWELLEKVKSSWGTTAALVLSYEFKLISPFLADCGRRTNFKPFLKLLLKSMTASIASGDTTGLANSLLEVTTADWGGAKPDTDPAIRISARSCEARSMIKYVFCES